MRRVVISTALHVWVVAVSHSQRKQAPKSCREPVSLLAVYGRTASLSCALLRFDQDRVGCGGRCWWCSRVGNLQREAVGSRHGGCSLDLGSAIGIHSGVYAKS